VLVELDGARVLTDPLLRRRILHLRRHREAGSASADGLETLDAVLVSHLHYDHLDVPSLRRLGRSVRVVLPRGGGGLLRRRGFDRVEEVVPGDTVEVGAVRVRAVPAEHDGRRRPLGASGPALGFVVAGSQSVYFAGDTDLFDGMSELAPVDVALLPIAGWGPTLPAGHMDAELAAKALRLLRPRVAVPIHWGTFASPFARPSAGQEELFALRAAELAPEVEVRLLAVGESCALA
jgi:L-ascorbate metabolism protein UlaG (beta-lactamase superfamily)